MRQCFLSLALVLVAATANAAGWGDLKVQFVYDGKAPEAPKANVNKDLQVCGQHDLRDESLVVNPDNGGIANVICYLYTRSSDEVPVHSDYEKLASTPVVLDNHQCRFEPHVQLLWTKQKLVLGNKDSVAHNAKLNTLVNAPVNPLIPAGQEFELQMESAERLPSEVSCSIHPWMRGWIVVKDNPYFGVSDADGNLVIKNLPAGEWQVQFWHEKAGYVREGKVNGKTVEWSKGRADVTITDGGTVDLGTVKLAPAAFTE